MKTRAILMGAMMLAGCSSAEEKLCRAHITERLLNPETASFSDFKPVSTAEIGELGALKEATIKLSNSIPLQGASYYQMRVRADGELGNKVTKIEFCGVDGQKADCACEAIDE
jgi:hypothetical protein